MNKLVVSVGGAAGLAGIVAFSSSALAVGTGGNGYTKQLETKAQALHMTSDQLTEQLKTHTLYQIAEDKGVSMNTLHAGMLTQAKQRWQENGLTAEQIQEREKAMEERQADCDGTGADDRDGAGMMMRGNREQD